MKRESFELEEMPYETLAKFGLTQEMIDDLPIHALEQIGQGRFSPVLPITVTNEAGEQIASRTRFALVRMEDGNVDTLFFPVLEKSPLESYSREQQNELLAGKAIIVDVKAANGHMSKAFVQIDTETKQVMSVATPVIGRNLEVLKEDLHLCSAELNVMQKGEPLTIISDDEPITVGIDLNSKTGLRFCAGDSQKWREESKREWDKYTFGCYGCWVMGDYGDLAYVPEDDYTEELWNEQKKSAQRNISTGIHK